MAYERGTGSGGNGRKPEEQQPQTGGGLSDILKRILEDREGFIDEAKDWLSKYTQPSEQEQVSWDMPVIEEPEQGPSEEEYSPEEPEQTKRPEEPLLEPIVEEPEEKEETEETEYINPIPTPKTENPVEEKPEEAPPSTADTYQSWLDYLNQQEEVEANEAVGNQSYQQEEESVLGNGYVQPVQKPLGVYPSGTLEYLQNNDLPIDWLNTPDGQYWLESRSQPQPEMLFPSETVTPSPNVDIQDFIDRAMNIGVKPAVAESYWDGYRRNSYVPSGQNSQSLNNAINTIANSLNNSETPAWLNTDNIIANREYTPERYTPTNFDEAVRSMLQEIPGRVGNAVVDSLANGTTNVPAQSAEQIIQNRDAQSTPYQPTELDAAVQSMLREIPGRLGNAVVNSLNEGTSNVNADSASAIIANRDRNGVPYQETDLDRAVKDIVGNVIGNSLNDQEKNAELAELMGVDDLLANRERDANNRFVNEDFNNSIRDIFIPNTPSTPASTPPVSAPPTAADMNLGNFEAFLELGRDQGLEGSELVQYAADELNRNSQGNGYVPTDVLRENTDRNPRGNGYVSTDYLREQNTPAENPPAEPLDYATDWRTMIDQWENAEAANNELFRESLKGDNDEFRKTLAKAGQSIINRWDQDAEADAWVAAHFDPNTPWDQIDAAKDALYEQYYEGLENGTIQLEKPLVGSNDILDWMDQADADVKGWFDQAGEDVSEFLTPDAETQRKYDEYEQATKEVSDSGIQEGTPEFYAAVNETLAEKEEKRRRLDEMTARLQADQEAERQQRYYRDLESRYRNALALQGQRNDNYRESVDQTYNDLLNQGYDPEIAKMLALNPDLTGLYDKTGQYLGEINDIVEAAPGYNADGTPNQTLQDILDGKYGISFEGLEGYDDVFHQADAERILHTFDRPDNGLVIPEGLQDYLATDQFTSLGNLDVTGIGETGLFDSSNPDNVEFSNLDGEEYLKVIDTFINANKALKDMVDKGILTHEDIARHFFKGPASAKPNPAAGKKSGGSGYRNYRSYGGGGGGRYYGGGGSSYSGYNAPNAKQQKEQRINNIMKNWSF